MCVYDYVNMRLIERARACVRAFVRSMCASTRLRAAPGPSPPSPPRFSSHFVCPSSVFPPICSRPLSSPIQHSKCKRVMPCAAACTLVACQRMHSSCLPMPLRTRRCTHTHTPVPARRHTSALSIKIMRDSIKIMRETLQQSHALFVHTVLFSYMFTLAYMHAHKRVRAQARTHSCIYRHTHAYAQTHAYAHAHTNKHTHTHTHTHIPAHTQTHTQDAGRTAEHIGHAL